MNSTPSITAEAIGTASADRAAATLALAFAADPVIRWLLPQPEQYLTNFPQTVRVMGEPAVEAGTADAIGDDAGIALWVPPGSSIRDEALGELVVRSIEAVRNDEIIAFMGQMSEYHPTEPHWYLPLIGVEPRHQGRGLGSRLLAWGLARADHDGLPAYLEASTLRNRALYERHGFVVTGEIQVADSPPMWPMLRPAATAY
jgi:GNAT superfamily N-acetyltransferase